MAVTSQIVCTSPSATKVGEKSALLSKRPNNSDNHDRLFRKEKSLNGQNDLKELDAPVHRWWRFVLAFPPHLVAKYLNHFDLKKGASVFDPFCGTGTTLVEAKKCGFHAIGSDALEFCYVASKVKTNWDIPVKQLTATAGALAKAIEKDYTQLLKKPLAHSLTLLPEQAKVLGKDYISPLPLHKLLVIRQHIHTLNAGSVRDFFTLALGGISVPASNVGFGPEIYVRKSKDDVDVLELWTKQIEIMLSDLKAVQELHYLPTEVFYKDARSLTFLKPASIDAVITSPPYPNEKNYLRITRVEHVITDLIRDRTGMRVQKKLLLRSNSGNMYKGDIDAKFVEGFASIQGIADAVEARRIELGKESGWEKLYPAVVRHYFGGMYRHLKALKSVLRPHAKCAYVVGDQMSFLMVHIKTGELIAEIADDIGFKVLGIDLWRDRWATASKQLLREEVVLLEKK